MKDTFLSARLVSEDVIRLIIFSSVPYEKFDTLLVKDRHQDLKLLPAKMNSMAGIMIIDYHLPSPLELGHSYALAIPSFGIVPLDVNEATSFPGFDEKFTYKGEDLGATYSKEATSFALWAPLASSVMLKYRQSEEKRWHYRAMERTEQGVYRLTLDGEREGTEYRYLVTNSETTAESTDPYAKASTPNSESSVVLDFASLKKDFKRDSLPILNSYTDAIIYEGSVRDLTIDKHSDIQKKGTFAGLFEKNRHTTGGHPAGFDYLVSLGITHLQLLPIYDFKTVDELHPEKNYNWGYDPVQYFVPEGSYASDVADPKSRIEDLQNLVIAYHQAGIRIVQDVVFNHVYEYLSSPFEKVVPNYYFRRKRNGRMANTSYCGDDVASERPMVRKLIVDACKWWISFYGIDGFRFDLMGILDVETLKEIEAYAKKVNPSFMLYGEGWNMGGEVSVPLGHMDNAKLLPGFAFFNDRFREGVKRYVSGDYSAMDLFKYALISSSMEYGGNKPLFLDANQTINYVECHDNATFFDYVSSSRPALPLEDKLELCKMALAVTLLSYGIPFIHAGEEIAQSKFGKDNTYNLPDVYNRFSYRLLDERYAMADYFRSLVAFRKARRFLHDYDERVFGPMVELSDENGVVVERISDGNEMAPYKEITFFYNPSDQNLPHELKTDQEILLGTSGVVEGANLAVSSLLLPKHSVMGVCLKTKK
jgi:pullulanase